ncbi:DUF1604-domain-containing protein [Aaosphaeria arxii CBS 175.79]|uniref:DUF1604-domain-containing protein n=1 Tax=Aaosphaeria arxii CBS 175.79 TaxID=1450172 RepID=A0A6A5Y0T4_9PLEO|nr:DUF1604-domain-containing protein [Aaosphaeria arxii CBS 175.79]KAF2018803.1 DUF1604-domain-containing protein [Aaosphaeria arxii CBS 175.79]
MAYKRPRAVSPAGSQKRTRGIDVASKTIKLGTELPSLDDGDDGAFVPVWKQTVTDERGRRRLHGAFTGGFSAGYFNTVGSKEGWTPKAFVSSRSNRNKDQPKPAGQRPEDFMDEEDLAQAAESRQLSTTQGFSSIGDSGKQSGPQDQFSALFNVGEETIGVKIIQKMGWRQRQGIGRKIRREARLGDGHDPKDSSERHLFAPADVKTVTITSENSRKGLGFESEARLSTKTAEDEDEDERPGLALPFLDSTKRALGPKKPSVKKSSFGVGVLNDTGSDDEDPYELGPKISLKRTIGKDKKAKKPSKFSKPGGERHVFVSKKEAPRTTTSLSFRPPNDGKPPLRGFVFAIQVVIPSKPHYPPPKIPADWKSSKKVGNETDATAFQSVADAAKASTLDSKARADLLGETPLPGKSVFDFISKENRDRIAALTGKTNLPQGLGESAPAGSENEGRKDLWSFVPVLDKSTAAGALAKGATGWMPYAEDPSKRTRYINFLELKSGLKQDLPEKAPGASVSDWVKEMQEFAHAAQVFKPTSGIMASRFTSSSTSTTATGDTTGTNLLHKPTPKAEDPAESAAKLGMYGAMTRTVIPFLPSRLLCKRFNVKPPPDVPFSAEFTAENTSKTQQAVSKAALDSMMRELSTQGSALQRPDWMTQPKPEAAAAVKEHATVDVESNEALTQERAPEDVFKSIFGDDDDDDE